MVKAAVPPQAGDEKLNPNYTPPKITELATTNQESKVPGDKLKMDQFLTKQEDYAWGTILEAAQPSTSKPKPLGTSTKKWGLNFCNKSLCKYCTILNKIGELSCHTTGIVYPSMHNIRCSSSNVITASHAKLVANNM